MCSRSTIRLPAVFHGYWREPADRFVSSTTRDNWLRSFRPGREAGLEVDQRIVGKVRLKIFIRPTPVAVFVLASLAGVSQGYPRFTAPTSTRIFLSDTSACRLWRMG